MGLFDLFTGQSQLKKALKCWEKFTLLVEKKEAGLLEKEMSSVGDLRIINMVINCTYMGRMKGLSSQTQKIIEKLFIARAEEILSNMSDVGYLDKLNNQLNKENQKDSFLVNQLESCIEERLKKLKIVT